MSRCIRSHSTRPFWLRRCKSVVPEVTDGETKVGQSIPVPRYSEVSDMPAHNGLQPLADFRNRVMHTPPQLDLDPLQLRLHALANRLPKHQKPSPSSSSRRYA